MELVVNADQDPIAPYPLDELLDSVLQRPIAFHRIFAELAGGALPGLFLSQVWYWSSRTTDPDGWFYKTQKEWEEETALDRYEQERARKILRTKGIIQEVRRGIPAQLYFRLCRETLHSSMRESAIKRAGIRRQVSGNPQSIPETTSEITTEKTLSPPLPPAGGKRRRRAKVLDTTYSVGFLAFWDVFPDGRAVAKPECFKLWNARQLEPRTDELVFKIERLRATSWYGKEPKFIPLAYTWLNQGRYEDALVPLATVDVTQRISEKGLRTAKASQRILEDIRDADDRRERTIPLLSE